MARAKPWLWTDRAPRPELPGDVEKQAIVAACERLIVVVLKPRFLPEIRPTEWNYVINIYGAWAAGRYCFIQRYRPGWPDNLGCALPPFFVQKRIASQRSSQPARTNGRIRPSSTRQPIGMMDEAWGNLDRGGR